jgi:hypothetical protein
MLAQGPYRAVCDFRKPMNAPAIASSAAREFFCTVDSGESASSIAGLVTRPIAPRVPRATLQGMQINIGVKRLILIRSSCSNLQDHCVSRASVLQVVPVRDTSFEASAIAWAKKFFAVIRHHDHLTLEHVNKLVLVGVPMPLARPSSRREAQQVNSELRKPRGISQAQPGSSSTRRVIRRGVPTPKNLQRCMLVNLLCHRNISSVFNEERDIATSPRFQQQVDLELPAL